jgi:COP9 signalosome complex subunit 5
VAEKLEQAETQLTQAGRVTRFAAAAGGGKKGGGDEGPLNRICRDVGKLSAEQVKGLSSQLVKALLFNCNPLQQVDGGAGGSGAGAEAGRAHVGEAPMES